MSALRILIAGHFIYAGRVGGAEHFVYNLVKGLARIGADVSILCADRGNLSPTFVDFCKTAQMPIVESGGRGLRFLSEQRACLDKRIQGTSILFPQYYRPPIISRRLGRPAVVIHDLQFRHFPEYFTPRKRAWLRLCHEAAFSGSTTVIVVSNFVRDDAIRLYGRRAEKTIVIPNPISWDRFSYPTRSHPFNGRPYFLTVAAQYPHKRLDILLRAFAIVARKRKDFLLVLCGQLPEALVSVGRDAADIRGLIKELDLNDRVIMTGYVSDERVGDLYRNAEAFAFPSVFEGFGMPAVEALGFGLPTLTTKCASLPEVTLGMAHYVDDPGSVSEWAARLDSLVGSSRVSEDNISRIRARYDVKSIAQTYLGALQV